MYEERVKEAFSKPILNSYHDFINGMLSKYRYVCIYGMGEIGFNMHNALLHEGFRVDYFCDSNGAKVGSEYRGIKCKPIEYLCENADNTLCIIGSADYYFEIKDKLKSLGIKHWISFEPEKFRIERELKEIGYATVCKNILAMMDMLEDNKSKEVVTRLCEGWMGEKFSQDDFESIHTKPQYFPKDIIDLSDNEVFYDCGAFTGDTFAEFVKQTDGKFNGGVLFELNKNICRKLTENVKLLFGNKKYDDSRVRIYPSGVSNTKREIQYSLESSSSAINENADGKGRVTTIDNAVKATKMIPTFIKMDIEGEEINALEGGKKTIINYHPRLAICLYHHIDHMYKIPEMIKEYNDKYTFYIRHHTNMLIETVLYAVS